MQSIKTLASYFSRNSSGNFPKYTKRVSETMSPHFLALTETIRYFSTFFSVGIGWRKLEIRSSAADINVIGSIRSFHNSLQSLPTTADSFSPFSGQFFDDGAFLILMPGKGL